jgi:hypothetical protein
LNKRVCRKPLNPTVSTGVVLTSRINFTILNLENASAGMKLDMGMVGCVMMKSGFDTIM